MFDSFGRISFSPHTKVSAFAERLEQGHLSGSRCGSCGYFTFPPRADCPECFSKKFELVAISGRGKVVTYCRIVAAPAGFEACAPYTIGLVDLEEGGRLLAWFGGSVPDEDIAIGLDVQVVPERIETEDGVRLSYTLEATGSAQ